MKPVCSATPTPSSATSTTPERREAGEGLDHAREELGLSAAPLNWFFTWMGALAVMSPAASRTTVRGSISVNWTGASAADNTPRQHQREEKRTAGSGSLLPAHSMPSSIRWGQVRRAVVRGAFMAGTLVLEIPGRNPKIIPRSCRPILISAVPAVHPAGPAMPGPGWLGGGQPGELLSGPLTQGTVASEYSLRTCGRRGLP